MTDGSGGPVGSDAHSRRETLRRLLEERAAARRYPPSLQQERLWVAHQMDPSEPSHNVRTALEIRGPLDRSLLVGAVDRLVARHEQLRARFPSPEDEPVTEIRPQLTLEPEILRLPAGVDAADAEEIADLLAAPASRPFDLERGPLARWGLLELGADHSIALFVFHHIVCDAWSINLFLHELVEILAAAKAGREPRLPAIESSYADVVREQRQRLEGERLATLEAFWRERLEGSHPAAVGPDAGERSAGATTSRRHPFAFSTTLTEGLEALSRQRGASLFMILLAAFAVLLARLTGEPEVIVATPVANRQRESWERLIGYFVNLLPLRIHCSQATDFGELLSEVRRQVLAAHEHQELPTHRIAQTAGVRQPALLEILFQHGSTRLELPAVDDLQLSVRGIDVGSSRTRLALATHLDHRRLAGTLEYRTASLGAAEAEQLVGDLRRVLEQVAEDDRIALDRLDVPRRWRQAVSRRDEAASPRSSDRPTEAPSDPLRRHLAAIWEDVLDVDRLSSFDNFLDVGGDSLAALQIIERVETELGVRLTPAELFTQTLAQLANLCERRRG